MVGIDVPKYIDAESDPLVVRSTIVESLEEMLRKSTQCDSTRKSSLKAVFHRCRFQSIEAMNPFEQIVFKKWSTYFAWETLKWSVELSSKAYNN